MSTDKSKKIGVLMGGLSTEREISIKSGSAVLEVLIERGWNAVAIDVDENIAKKIIDEKIEIAYNALHGVYGEDGCIQGLLEILKIPYTGSGVRASAVSMDKIATKRALQHLDIRLIKDQLITRQEYVDKKINWDNIELPVVVKDPVGGSSIGIWVCKDKATLQSAVDEAFEASTIATLLLEEFVSGEEITAAVLYGKALPIVAIRPKNEFFDLEAKYTKGKTDYLVPAPISDSATISAQHQAVIAYNELGMRGIARADFLLPEDGIPRFLEINSSPGMTATSLSPMAAGSDGMSFGELVELLIENATCEIN